MDSIDFLGSSFWATADRFRNNALALQVEFYGSRSLKIGQGHSMSQGHITLVKVITIVGILERGVG